MIFMGQAFILDEICTVNLARISAQVSLLEQIVLQNGSVYLKTLWKDDGKMTNHYLRNAVPDHIAGVISACEGIQNNLVLPKWSPIGCKTYYTFSGVDSLIRRSNLWTLGDELRLEDAMDDRVASQPVFLHRQSSHTSYQSPLF